MMINLNAEASSYKRTLQDFVSHNGLSPHWFERQDHLAFKAYSTDDYGSLLEQFMPISSQISEIVQANRRLAVARLAAEYAVDMTLRHSNKQSMVQWVEIMEAKPADQSDRPTRLDHVKIYHPSLPAIRQLFLRNNISYDDQANESHAWVSLQISHEDDELKFTDVPLQKIVEKEIADGSARIL